MLTDWHMPFLSGIELLRRIRQGPVRKETPVVLLSSEASVKVEALAVGANGFLQKPFLPKKLCEDVLQILAALTPAHFTFSMPSH